MNYLFLTDNPEIAAYVDRCGVRRIFLDLEILGKVERQGGRDTVVSRHRQENIAPVREALDRADLLVRVNPLHPGTLREIEDCIDAGADYLMLPMFRCAEHLEQFCRYVAGRIPVIPLVETAGAMHDIEKIIACEGVAEVYIGLNDLHLDLGLSFMFETLANGMVDRMADSCRAAGMTFGVGGISAVGQGLIPGEMVLAEHARIGSKWTILSRSFHQRATNLADLKSKVDLPRELAALRTHDDRLALRTPDEVAADHDQFCRCVRDVASKIA